MDTLLFTSKDPISATEKSFLPPSFNFKGMCALGKLSVCPPRQTGGGYHDLDRQEGIKGRQSGQEREEGSEMGRCENRHKHCRPKPRTKHFVASYVCSTSCTSLPVLGP